MSSTTKLPRATVLPVAEHIVDTLRPYCDRIELAGSLRRERPLVGDIEIVALPTRPVDLFGNAAAGRRTDLDSFLTAHAELLKNGPRYKQFRHDPYTVDLFLPAGPETWGAIYTIRTGSLEFNLWLMQTVSPARGIRFHEGRLYGSDGQVLDTLEEADVFVALQLPFIPPADRDDNKWLRDIRKEN